MSSVSDLKKIFRESIGKCQSRGLCLFVQRYDNQFGLILDSSDEFPTLGDENYSNKLISICDQISKFSSIVGPIELTEVSQQFVPQHLWEDYAKECWNLNFKNLKTFKVLADAFEAVLRHYCRLLEVISQNKGAKLYHLEMKDLMIAVDNFNLLIKQCLDGKLVLCG